MLRQDLDDVTDDLYDSLQLQSLLQREEIKTIKNSGDERRLWRTSGTRSEWQRFLDDLCFLCDTQRGGKTTTSVAAEQSQGKVILWLAMNDGDLSETKRYLQNVLDTILDIEKTSARTLQRTDRIVAEAISRSPQRVANYADRLRNVLEELGSGSLPGKSRE